MRQRDSCLLATGISVVTLSVILFLSWGDIFNMYFKRGLTLTPSSWTYRFWKQSLHPVVVDIYLFNCSNRRVSMESNFVPELVQLGPYRFLEHNEKVNITWNKNNTVSYKMKRHWVFDEENSIGSLSDNITTLNIAPLVMSYLTKNVSSYMSFPLSATIRMFGKSVWMTKTAGEVLLYGYEDRLVTMHGYVPGAASSGSKADKIGLLYERNNSPNYEGVYNVGTGKRNISDLGDVRNWNYDNRTDNFEAHCGKISGSSGDIFGPISSRNDSIYIFIPDLCRDVRLDYASDTAVNGVVGYRYELSSTILDNGTADPDTSCNCAGECLPQGVINTTTCLHNAPQFISLPHFMDADPQYRRRVSGMHPDPQRHRFYVSIEPKTGIPLEFVHRLQLNFLLQPNRIISLYREVPTIMFPLGWFEKRYTITPEQTQFLKWLFTFQHTGKYFAVGVFMLGTMLALCSVTSCIEKCFRCRASARRKRIYLGETEGQGDFYKPLNGEQKDGMNQVDLIIPAEEFVPVSKIKCVTVK